MASARTLRAGKAIIELALQGDEKIAKALNVLEQKSRQLAATFTKIGTIGAAASGAIAAAFAAATRTFIQSGDQLQKMAIRTGFSVEALSGLRYAAGQSGTSIEGLDKAVKAMARGILDAERGLATANDNLSDLGITLADLQGKSPEQQFLLFASRIASVDDATKRAALAMKVFGKSGAELLPLMANGVDGITDLIKRAEELGLVMSQSDADAAAKLGDAFDDLWSQVKRFQEQIGAAIAGELTALVLRATEIGKAVIQWAQNNRTLVATFAKVTAAVFTLSSGLISAGLVLKAFAISLHAIRNAAIATRIALIALSRHPYLLAFTLTITAATTAAAGLSAAFDSAVPPTTKLEMKTTALEQVYKRLGETMDEVAGKTESLAIADLSIDLDKAKKELGQLESFIAKGDFGGLISGKAGQEFQAEQLRKRIATIQAEIDRRNAEFARRTAPQDATAAQPSEPSTAAGAAIVGGLRTASTAFARAIGAANKKLAAAMEEVRSLTEAELERVQTAQAATFDRADTFTHPGALLDTRYARQFFAHAGGVEEAQLAELKGLRKDIKNRQPGIPVA